MLLLVFETRIEYVVVNGFDASVKLVEQELWQREEKGLIGILPVRDAAGPGEASSAGLLLSPGD